MLPPQDYTAVPDELDANATVQEKRRQKHSINLIPSENFTSQAVLEALGSVMQSMHATSWLLFN